MPPLLLTANFQELIFHFFLPVFLLSIIPYSIIHVYQPTFCLFVSTLLALGTPAPHSWGHRPVFPRSRALCPLEHLFSHHVHTASKLSTQHCAPASAVLDRALGLDAAAAVDATTRLLQPQTADHHHPAGAAAMEAESLSQRPWFSARTQPVHGPGLQPTRRRGPWRARRAAEPSIPLLVPTTTAAGLGNSASQCVVAPRRARRRRARDGPPEG